MVKTGKVWKVWMKRVKSVKSVNEKCEKCEWKVWKVWKVWMKSVKSVNRKCEKCEKCEFQKCENEISLFLLLINLIMEIEEKDLNIYYQGWYFIRKIRDFMGHVADKKLFSLGRSMFLREYK